MARFRTLKPETFSDEKLAEVSRDCRLLFIGLWCFCDDMGRKAYAPKRIQLEVFPSDTDLTTKLVDKWSHELERVDLIRLYKVDGKEYLWIPRFLRHQRIDRPSHSYLPPHPQDRDPDCCCSNCRIAAGDTSLIRHENELYEPHNYSRKQRHNSRNVPDFTRGALDESSNTRGGLEEASGRSVVEWNGVSTKNQDQNQHQEQQQGQNQPPPDIAESKAENRRAERREVQEIAMRMVRLLELADIPMLLQAVTKTIEVKAKSRNSSVEWAGQHILGKAALVAAESPPDDWVLWFEDARYEYVPEGDSKLKDRRIEARPVCGGPRCSDGWEMVKVGDVVTLRRCPDCVRSWKDAGL